MPDSQLHGLLLSDCYGYLVLAEQRYCPDCDGEKPLGRVYSGKQGADVKGERGSATSGSGAVKSSLKGLGVSLALSAQETLSV